MSEQKSPPIVQANAVQVGVCRCGNLIGIDMIDADGMIISHAHFDAETAVDFAEDFGDAIGRVIAGMASGTPN
tara:strand:+ start:434 stop:652 length:219 start_codon:yes stop_codon:yes gene_type:complete